MRTTKANERKLLSEARKVLGLKHNRDISRAVMPFSEAVRAVLGTGTVTPYRNNSWGIAWVTQSCRDCFVYVDEVDFGETPEAFVQKYLQEMKRQDC